MVYYQFKNYKIPKNPKSQNPKTTGQVTLFVGQLVADHFIDVNKMIISDKGVKDSVLVDERLWGNIVKI